MAIACPDCGTIQTVPVLSLGDAAICPTCDHHLERTAGRSMVAAFSCAFSVFILLFPANLLPLMSVTMLSVRHTSHLASGVGMLWNTHWVVIAALVGMFAVVLPFIRFGLLSLVLGCVLTRYRPAWLGWGFRWTLALDAWAMPDVFLIGCAVGYSRVRANLPVTIEWGGICFIAAALLSMLSRASLDRRTAWRTIAPERQLDEQVPAISCTICDLVVPADAEGTPCSRCGQTLGARKPDTLIRTTALVIAGAALYIPANIFPMSTALQMGQLVPHRIIDGVRELISAGLWPLAILITCTSIAIPLLKLVGLGWFVVSVHRRSRSHLVFKTKLYRLIDEVGRWSCIDVFTIAVFLPLLHFDSLASTRADTGAAAFILVVTLTMIASRTFDPRLLWDMAR
ncbi:MAG TPA: paraquat-inducible protein A [Gemmatimonadaceae bacterium]|nr:paraquat-inducible protein A [Gemmatimonadaceae bacterium]